MGSGTQYLLNAAVGGTSKMVIQNNGNVGIGTTSPSQLLTVGNNNQFTVASTGALSAGSNFTVTAAGNITATQLNFASMREFAGSTINGRAEEA